MKNKCVSLFAVSMFTFAFSAAAISPVASDVGAPYANTESFTFPALNVCHVIRGLSTDTADEEFSVVSNSSARLGISASSYSPYIDCAIPFKYDRFIRSIVVSAKTFSGSLRDCKVAPVVANSGTAATEPMPIVSWNGQSWFRHDDLGVVPFYAPGTNQQYAYLRISCGTWNGVTSFSHIRVDYDV